MKSELMSIRELFDCCRKHNSDNHIERQFEDKHPLTCYVVVKQECFDRPFTELERTYKFDSDNKRFISGLCGNSIFADCLDEKDLGIRLDWYLGEWQFEKCWYETND